MKFPYECCRCGLCCIIEPCPIAIQKYNITKQDKCPAFRYDKENKISTCTIVCKSTGVNLGCCIKARVFKDGIEYDFASLPSYLKIQIAFNTYMKGNEDDKTI